MQYITATWMFLVIVCSLFSKGDSLTCYQCLDCPPFGSESTAECPTVLGVEPVCMKVVGPAKSITQRSCSFGPICSGAESVSKCDGWDDTNCSICCSTNKCNDSTALRGTSLLITLASLLIFIKFYIFIF